MAMNRLCMEQLGGLTAIYWLCGWLCQHHFKKMDMVFLIIFGKAALSYEYD